MKSPPLLGAAAIAACLMAQPAFAYQLSPKQTRSFLTGQLQFVNGGTPFTCNVTLVLRTHGGGGRGGPVFERGNSTGRPYCNSVLFSSFPWQINVTSASGGTIVGGSWSGGTGGCGETFTAFSVNAAGIWNFPPQDCITGNMTSSPPVTIVP